MGERHGYGRYTRGCRCDVCRAAKADYMRARRSRASRAVELVARTGTGGRNYVPAIKHGPTGHRDHGCRCDACLEGRRAVWRAEKQRARARA